MTKKRTFWFWWILLATPVLVFAGLFLGEGWQHPSALFSPGKEGILVIRFWRVLLGILVGVSLSIAGAILQAVLRNPLAEPYVLGLSSGAGLGTALAIIAGGLSLHGLVLPAAGFLGSSISLLAVYQLARVGHRTSPHTLILAGVIWSSLCGSLLMFMVSQSSAEGLHAILWWFLGDLQVFDVGLVKLAFLLVAAVLVFLAFLARSMNALMLGEESTEHLGLEPEKLKMMLLVMASIITAASVCVSGLIAFVGLTVPHAARALVGPDHRRLLPAAACLGAVLVVWGDGIGRAVLFPVEIPVGVITAFIGGPFFLILLRRKQKEMWI